MANADSTLRNEPNSPDESYLAEEYPISGDPFSVFYSVGTGLKWAINDEDGMAIAEAANYEDAVKIANAFRAGAYLEAVNKANELKYEFTSVAVKLSRMAEAEAIAHA